MQRTTPSQQQTYKRFAIALPWAIVSLLLGLLIPVWSPGLPTLLLIFNFVLCVSPLVHNGIRNRFDVFEPIVWINICCVVMFVVRPTALLASNQMIFRNQIDIQSTFTPALAVTTIGILFIQIGYFSRIGDFLANRIPTISDHVQTSLALPQAILMLTVSLIMHIRLIASGQGVDSTTSTAYVYLAPFLIVPASLLILNMFADDKRATYLIISLVLFYSISLAPTGRRLMLMQIALVFIVFWYIVRERRPSVWTIAVFAIASFYFIVAMRDLQPGDTIEDFSHSVLEHIKHSGESLNTLVLSNDTEMFDGLASEMQLVPSSLSHSPGSSAIALITHPIPRLLWPNKPRAAEDIINLHLFHTDLGMAGVAYSIFGGFYYDSGFVGVAIGAAFVGLLFRLIWEFYLANVQSRYATAFYAAFLPFVVSILRGNLQYLLAISLFSAVPILITAWLSSIKYGHLDQD